jgi:HlyD family secretion protein
MKLPMIPKRAVAVGLIAVILIAAAVTRYWSNRTNEGVIAVSGTIEATEVDIESKVTGRIEQIAVDEGDRVTKGQVLVQIERRELEAQVRSAEALVQAARANLANLVAGSREEEIRKAEAALAEARANLEKSQKDWERIGQLFLQKLVSDQERDRAVAAYEVAKAQEREAREHLALLKAGTREEVIEAARGELKRAEAALELARVQLEDTALTAPLDATVLLKIREPGELAIPGTPILTLGDLDHPWVMVYVKETDLGRIHLGDAARVYVDSFPGKAYPGKITFISEKAEFTPKTIQTQEERVKLVFAAKVAVENPNGELKPGMPADVELSVNREK